MKHREGHLVIDTDGHEIYYRLFGNSGTTLVGLHGGPGADHRYLERLGELADNRLQVLIYDQLGSGKSDRPDDPSLWNVQRFVDELEVIRTKLNLGKIVLMGQSWGGMLALQYTLDYPDAVSGLVLSNTGSSTGEILRGMTQIRSESGRDFTTMLIHEGRKDFTHPDYEAAVMRLYSRHLRRSTPFDPETSLVEFETEMHYINDVGPAYSVMWGPHEFLCNGPLMSWDVTDRLKEIDIPTQILCGYYDEVTVPVHRILADRILDNEFQIFGNSSHMTILEKESDAYLAAMRSFIDRKIMGQLDVRV